MKMWKERGERTELEKELRNLWKETENEKYGKKYGLMEMV